MGCVFLSCPLDDIEILPDDLVADFDIEDSLAGGGEVHLCKLFVTSANLSIKVFFPDLTGRV